MWCLATAGLAAACSGALPRPPFAAQPPTALVEVTVAPPPGRVEDVPTRPKRGAVWIDGEWTWRRHKWSWHTGYWADPPPGAKLSPWVFEVGVDGRLWYAQSAWRDANGAAVPAPAVLAAATVDQSEVVDATGDTQNTGSNLPAGPLATGRDGGAAR
jgi:hypothetical protein